MLKKEQLLSAEEPFRPHIVMTVGVKGLEYGFHGYTPLGERLLREHR